MNKRVTVYLVSGDLLHYFRPADQMTMERNFWMDIINNTSMHCVLAGGNLVIIKDQIKYVEFEK